MSMRCGLLAITIVGLSAVVAMNAAASDSCGSGTPCDHYRKFGALYSDPQSSGIQEFTLRGRFQFQSVALDGTAAGGETIDYSRNEIRRMYVGARITAFHVLDVGGQANIFRDTVDERGFEFVQMWDLTASIDANKAFGWHFADALSIGYGAAEVGISEEWRLSSTAIKTIERSAIANNKAWAFNQISGNPTGVFVNLKSGALSGTAGLFSTTTAKVLAGWGDGLLYELKLDYDYSSWTAADTGELMWGFFYQDVDVGDEALADGVKWVTSVATLYGRGRWVLRAEGIVGNNGDTTKTGDPKDADRTGSFFGLNVMPSIWLKGSFIEGVLRFQYQSASKPEGIGINGRYVRAPNSVEATLPFPTRGDRHRALGAEVNLYFWGNNLKFMFGVQYDDVASRGASVIEGWTYGAAFRTFF